MNEFENNELNEESESGKACGDCAAEENGKMSAAEVKATGEKSACADCESEGGAEASACGCACGNADCEEGAEAKSGEAEEIGEDGSEACVEDEKYTPAYKVFCASGDWKNHRNILIHGLISLLIQNTQYMLCLKILKEMLVNL